MIRGAATIGYLHPGTLSTCFHNSLQGLLFSDIAGRQRVMSHPYGEMGKEAGSGGIVAGRNQIAQVFLDESEAEWLMVVDSDMGFEADTLERLVELGDPYKIPVVGALCFALKSAGRAGLYAQRFRATPTLYSYVETEDGEIGFLPMFDYPRDQLVNVAATGCACLLVHRHALDKVRSVYGDVWFDTITTSKGKNGPTTFSEDLSFCVRLRACDVPLHVHTGVKTTHHKGGVYLDEETYDIQQAALAAA